MHGIRSCLAALIVLLAAVAPVRAAEVHKFCYAHWPP